MRPLDIFILAALASIPTYAAFLLYSLWSGRARLAATWLTLGVAFTTLFCLAWWYVSQGSERNPVDFILSQDASRGAPRALIIFCLCIFLATTVVMRLTSGRRRALYLIIGAFLLGPAWALGGSASSRLARRAFEVDSSAGRNVV